MSGYLLGEDGREARHRLSVKEKIQDPATVAFLETIGVSSGWRCLEVGAGGGSVAAWLCQRVGASGGVVATDVDTCFLENLDLGNLTVLRHDVVSDPLEREAFDLVHARDLLVHVPQRDMVLRKMAGAVKPGGWILLEEPDAITDGADPTAPEPTGALYTKVVEAIYAFLHGRGLDPSFGSRLYGLLRALGFEGVQSEGRVRMFRGGSRADESPHMMAFAQLREAVVAEGWVTAREFDMFLGLASDSSFAWRETLTVSAWGRRPGGSR